MARPWSPAVPTLAWARMLVAVASVLRRRDAVLLVNQQDEVAGGVGRDGVELPLLGNRAESGKDKLLGPWCLIALCEGHRGEAQSHAKGD